MKKLVMGLVGVVLSCLVGCQSEDLIKQEAQKFNYYSNEIRKIIGADPNDSYRVFPNIGEKTPIQAIIYGEKGTKIIIYSNFDNDGAYEKSTTTIPKKLDIRVIPADPNKGKFKKYIPKNEIRKRIKRKGWIVYND